MHHQSDKNNRVRNNMHLASLSSYSDVVPSLLILFTLMMEAVRSSDR
jgi:hypothetical protein